MANPLKRDVVQDIIRRHRQGLPLSAYLLQRGTHTDPRLYRLAGRAFGTWNGALKATIAREPGIWSSLPGMVLGHIFSRTEIVVLIRRRFDEGLPVNRSDIIAGPQADYPLYNLGLHKIGSWANALRAAGIISINEQRYRKRRYPRAADVIAEIKRRHTAGVPITYKQISRVPHANHALLLSAKKIFGSWHSAVLRAGLTIPSLETLHERFRRYRRASSVLAEIRRRHRKGLSLYHIDLIHRPPGDLSLLSAAQRLFGTWTAAVRAAGLSYVKVCPRTTRPRRYPDSQAVLAAIRARHKTGQPLNCAFIERADCALYQQAVALFGSWRKAIEKAGFDYASVRLPTARPSRYPTAESVVAGIRQRKARGLPLNAGAVEKGPTRDRALLNRGKKYFGTWRAAIESAGIRTCAKP